MNKLIYTLLFCSLTALGFGARPINPEEKIILYPAMGTVENQTIFIQGRVYDPETDSAKRNLFIKGMAKILDLDDNEAENAIFRERALLFLYEGKENVSFRVGQEGTQRTQKQTSGEDGFFAPSFISNSNLGKDHLVSYYALTDDGRRFSGSSLQLAKEGLSIISDIDDTIKITNVLQRKEMLRNTFIREFKVVPGIADLYRKILAEGYGLHFVSAGPIPLAPALLEFFQKERFPAHTITMRHIVKIQDINKITEGAEAFKVPAIREIFQRYPSRNFLLVGDSGEKDPEVYSAIQQEFPKQVIGVWIRNITDEAESNDRFTKLYPGEKAKLLRLFKEVSELPTSFGESF